MSRDANSFSDDVVAALAEVVVDIDHRDSFRLERLAMYLAIFGIDRLLAERRAEQKLVAGLRQVGSLAAHDFAMPASAASGETTLTEPE